MNENKDWVDCEGVSSLIVEGLGEFPLLRVEESLLLDLRRIEKMMRRLEVCKESNLFTCFIEKGVVRIKAKRLGNDFVLSLLQGVYKFDYHFPVHEVNPYIEVFYKCIKRLDESFMFDGWEGLIDKDAMVFLEAMNRLVCFARSEMSGKVFKKLKGRFYKGRLQELSATRLLN